MSDEREPLYGDKAVELFFGGNPSGVATAMWAIAMRNNYEARIAELEARLAQTWQPLPDGEVSSFIYIDNGGKLLGVFAGDDYTDWYATEDLPDDIRLCRLVESQPLDMPQPDWTTAPEWAQWWAVDPCDEAMWYEKEPIRYTTVTYCGWGASVIYGIEQGMKIGAGAIELPIGIDWRTTLHQRPTEDSHV